MTRDEAIREHCDPSWARGSGYGFFLQPRYLPPPHAQTQPLGHS